MKTRIAAVLIHTLFAMPQLTPGVTAGSDEEAVAIAKAAPSLSLERD